MRKRLHTLLCLLFISSNLFAQQPLDPLSALSPNAASLGLYGDMPISLFTGTPQINIPLYEIVEGDFKMPISLSYHASGVRPDQRPGWVGLNWNLFAGGAITRTHKDSPDEYNNPNYSNFGNAGYYYNYGMLNTWNNLSYLREIAQDKISLYIDTEPDEFYFHFLDYHGKFLLNHLGQWVVKCNKPIKVQFDGQFLPIPFEPKGRAESYGYSPSFSGFTIITEDGTQFFFGGTVSAIEYSIGFFSQAYDDWTATSWYLTKIITPQKHVITFTYEPGEFINQMYLAVHHNLGSYTQSSGFLSLKCDARSAFNINASSNGKLIAPTYLAKIQTQNSSIYFKRSESNELKYSPNEVYGYKYSNWAEGDIYDFLPFLESDIYGYPQCLGEMQTYKLDSIIIKNNNSSTVKSFILGYNNITSRRLMLLSLTESGKNPFKFSYDHPELLPGYLSNKVDHWGYYNDTYASVYPFFNESTYTNYYNLREPNISVLRYGSLNKVTYPTGGYTEFVYEPHQYRSQIAELRSMPLLILSANKYAGGLRIKKIIDCPTSTGENSFTKEYFYVSDYLQNKSNANTSSGILGGQFKYYFDDYIVEAFNGGGGVLLQKAFSSISQLPSCNNSNGSHIGYTEVIEKFEDESFKRYKFTNFGPGRMDETSFVIIQQSRTPYEPYASNEQERGLLELEEYYNSEMKLVKKRTLSYQKDNETSTNYVRAMKAQHQRVCFGIDISFDEGCYYKTFMYSMRLISDRSYLYDNSGNNIIESGKYFQYDSNNQISTARETISDGKVKQVEFKYPYNYSSGIYPTMVADNMISPIIEKITRVNNDEIERIKTNYGNVYDLFLPLSTQISYAGDSKMRAVVNYDLYDSQGNIIQTTEINGRKTYYIWGYNGLYPVAKIENAPDSSLITPIVDYINPLTGNLSAAQIAALRALPNTQITTYTYKPLIGMTSMTDPSGRSTYYEYDAYGRLITVSDENAVNKELIYHYKSAN